MLVAQHVRSGADSPSRLGTRLRSVLVATVSAFVLLAAVLYVVAPANPTLELSVRELGSAPSYDRDLTIDYSLAAASVAARAKYKETFYGEVSSRSGIPVNRARLLVTGVGKRTRGHSATAWIGGKGTYRAVVRLRPGYYRVTIKAYVAGKPKRAGKVIALRNGRFYEASLRVHESGIVTMLPITSY